MKLDQKMAVLQNSAQHNQEATRPSIKMDSKLEVYLKTRAWKTKLSLLVPQLVTLLASKDLNEI